MSDELTELLDAAMYKEIASQAFYIAGQNKTRDPGAKALMKELAKEELKHLQWLKNLKERGLGRRGWHKEKVPNLMISEYLTGGETLESAGLLEDMDYDAKTTFGDPQLKFHFAQADKLPETARNLIISIVAAMITYLQSGGRVLHESTFSLSGDNTGLMCPFKLISCDEGYCQKCQAFHDWRLGEGHD